MHVVDALAVLADRLGRIRAAAVFPADVQAESDAGIQVLDELPAVSDAREHFGRVRSVVVDCIADVELADELVDLEEQRAGALALVPGVLFVRRLIGNADQKLHAQTAREFKLRTELGGVLHVDGAESVGHHGLRGTFRLERRDVGVRRRERQMEVLDAEVVDVGFLHRRQRLVQVLPAERVSGDADLERNLGRGDQRNGRG